MIFKFLKLLSVAFCMLPRKMSLVLGIGIGLTLYYFIPFRRGVALTNLKIAFPNKRKSELEVILKKCYKHFGLLIADFLQLPNLNSKNISSFINFNDKAKNLLNRNSSNIIMTGHFGNWELFLPMLGYNGFRSSGVAQKQKNKSGEEFFKWLRNFKNTSVITKKNSIEAINNILDEKQNLVLVSDQYAGKRGTQNNFFKKQTSTPKGAAIFSFKKKIPILLFFIYIKKDSNYYLEAKELKINKIKTSKKNYIEKVNQIYNDELENIVKKYPEQYFWFHKRFDRKFYK